MKSIILILLAAVSVRAAEPNYLLTIDQVASAEQIKKIKTALADVSSESIQKDFNKLFHTAEFSTGNCEVSVQVKTFKEVVLPDAKGSLVALHWNSTGKCKSTQGTVQRDRIVWMKSDGSSMLLSDKGPYDPECGAEEYSFEPLGAENLFKEEWLTYRENFHHVGCANEMDVNTSSISYFHINSGKLTGHHLEKVERQIDETRNAIIEYKFDMTKCKDNKCPGTNTLSITTNKKGTVVVEKEPSGLVYSPKFHSIGHQ